MEGRGGGLRPEFGRSRTSDPMMVMVGLVLIDRVSLATAGSFANGSNNSMLNIWICLGFYT